MPGTINTLLIDGSFEELAEELAAYVDDLKKKSGNASSLQSDVAPLLQQQKQQEVLKKLVDGSAILSSAPEKEFVAAYNLLIHLIKQAPEQFQRKCLSMICRGLQSPITSSPTHGSSLALTVLTTIFNTLPVDDDSRFHVFGAILNVIKSTGNFEILKPQLKSLDSWLQAWEIDSDDERKLFLTISSAAEQAEETDDAYFYLLKALRSFESDEVESAEAKELSVRAVKMALNQPRHFDFQDLTVIDSVQALRKSESPLFDLLEIFTSQGLEEYNDFKDEHGDWLEQQDDMDKATLNRKMRLLTLASLAAQAQNRTLPYDRIRAALQISEDDIELWVIDVIRAGLVEGKLSQLNRTLLIHRSTYRVFGEKQWAEVQVRLDNWRNSLENVLAVVRQEREKVIREKERELKEIDGRVAQATSSSRRYQQRDIDPNAD